ncbi:hypothetical protein N7449_007468 [Penicillium cf. viridicatum]|uniref:5'-3' DNA helicase ZGRF1-like N-terminal domain-containing protein n=1 Tax=Penicillium cf. viridicatum TaxID=2972119 RepID=A0A9W9MCP9_9EURO|nr:hypothetical protein N7449_007468 [Penicillium cf. viridicatum]
MMSTPSSSTRLPPTSPQVTASVVKFRCLYTHDLRRKSKRWHDGYLRYHKFNKRVMVYDDQGNFIGDHHWRSSDEVQDGDEMELDKGVLIEVTENMGTTETDITTLYEKKKSSQGSPQTKDPVSQVPRASTYTSTSAPLRSSASSQSFRSLNDLLGIKRTPIGHLVSPYEEGNAPRQAASSIQEPGRAPKRQKTSSVVNQRADKGSGTQSEVIDLTDSTDSNQGLPAKPRSNQVVKELPRSGGDSTVDVLSTDCEQRSTVQSKKTRPQRLNPPSFSRVSVSTGSKPTSSLLPPEEVVRTATKGVQPPRPLGPSSKGYLPTIPTEAEISGPQGNLRVEQTSINRENQSRALSRPIPPQRSDPPTVSRSSLPIAPKQSPAVLSTRQPPVRVVSNYEKPIEATNDQTSTNVPPPADVLSPAHVPPPVNISSSTKMPPPSRPSSAPRSGAPTTALRMGTGKPRRKLMYSALLPGASRTPSPVTSDTPTLPGSAAREPTTNTPEQQLAAGPSDSSNSNEEFMPSTSTQFIFDEMIDGSGFKPSSTIKRLTTARQARVGGSFRAANKENEPKEQGPWTSEALDLFDFWPAGRAKPND